MEAATYTFDGFHGGARLDYPADDRDANLWRGLSTTFTTPAQQVSVWLYAANANPS